MAYGAKMSDFRDRTNGKEKTIDTDLIKKAEYRMGVVKAKLVLQHPFYGVLLSITDFIHEAAIPTMATDGTKIYYNAEFTMGLADDEVYGVLLHEISHMIYMHCTRKRRMNRDNKRWNYACFPAGTSVGGSEKTIENLEVGDTVFGRDGQLQKVTQIMCRDYNGKMFSIKGSGTLPFICTDEHPILVVPRIGTASNYPIRLGDAVFKAAKDVDIKMDYLVVPKIQGDLDLETINLNKYLNQEKTNGHNQCHNIADGVKGDLVLDEEFAWMMGLYAAEGSKTNAKNHGIQFSLHAKETEYRDRLVKIGSKLGYSPGVYVEDNRMSVQIHSTLISKFFEEQMGRGAHNKRIPDMILRHKNLKIVEAFVNGLMDGDGCDTRKNNTQLGTVSLQLALHTQQAIGRLGIFACMRKIIVKERMIRGQKLEAGHLYVVDWNKPESTPRTMNGHTIVSHSERWKVSGNNYLVPITEKVESDFNGKVFNFETEDHTYMVSNAVVHNCDFAINLEIKDMGFKLPKEVLLDEKFRNMNAEMIYDDMPNDPEKKYGTAAQFDMHIESSDESEWDDMEDKILTAYEMTRDSKGKGDIPAGIKRWIEKMKKSKVKWERIFHRFVGSSLSRDDYSYTRVNKRYIGQDIYLPDLRSPTIGSVVIGVDTSGSIGQEQLKQFAAEIAKIGHLVNEIFVMTCDAEVHEVVKINKFDNFMKKLKFSGGGGTDMTKIFDKIKELKLLPELCVIITDGFTPFGNPIKAYPMLWCLTEDGVKVPWGHSCVIPKN
jgi:predicted metal-dependent peptidase